MILSERPIFKPGREQFLLRLITSIGSENVLFLVWTLKKPNYPAKFNLRYFSEMPALAKHKRVVPP
jgi:hypothetical protein